MLMIGIALLVICVAMSTREQRAEARVRMKPIGRILLIPVALVWIAIILTWPRGH